MTTNCPFKNISPKQLFMIHVPRWLNISFCWQGYDSYYREENLVQCVSYKQMCYQAVNTRVMGLLVLISVFISVQFQYTSRFRPQLCLLHGAGKLSCRVSAGTVTLSPHASHLQPHPWQSRGAPMGVTMLQCPWGWGRPRRAPTAWLKSQSAPWSLALQFLLVEEANKSHMGKERARTLREDSPSP